MALFTISDLHLPLGIDKPMDIFGKAWENYVPRIEEEWKNAISIPITLAATETLREAMQQAIKDENYELAMKLKQEIDNRTEKKEATEETDNHEHI